MFSKKEYVNRVMIMLLVTMSKLLQKYSTASDVWSYGMVLFEIWSMGKKPFSMHTNIQVLKLLEQGFCQPPPPRCPRAIYELMVNCW